MSTFPVTPETTRNFRVIGLIATQLALVLLVIHQFEIESRTFFHVMVLGSVGFVAHALLPMRYRLASFTVLSLASIVLAMGLRDGTFLILLGLVLIAISRLPVRLALRVALLAMIGALFALWRMELLPSPWSVAIWPILASMFMFRLALYMYTVTHDQKRPTAVQTLAYFFMLPNVCFPLYPVIDYPTFVRTYYDREDGRIYTTGMRWIVRGLIHLILYRFVYLHLVRDPSELLTFRDLIQFLLATFLLYLRVSGQFHLIAGVLHLYGFRLPETHHLYYLSSSFTDFWRRINIYWKDFMMKLVYYPSYFKLRRWGAKFAMITSTIIVFFATWILHSYQWFWLRGGFPLELQDVLFWSILGGLVVFGALREMKHPSKRTLRQTGTWSALLALRTVGTFATICVLWSIWSSDSLETWLTMWSTARNITVRDLWLLAGLLIGALLVAGRRWSVREADTQTALPFYRQPALYSTVLPLALVVFGSSDFYAPYAPQLATIVRSLERSTLNAHDAALRHKGYYEKLDNVSRMSAQLWDIRASKPSHWVPLSETQAYRVHDDFMRSDLRPDVHITFEDQPLTTNHWGMRDRVRAVAKSPRTYRIALLGPSHVMGSGVADDETIARFLEERLNRSSGIGTQTRYEVLNFGVAGYSLLQQLALLEQRAVTFQPDAVFIVDSSALKTPVIGHLENLIVSRVKIPYPELNDLIHKAGIKTDGSNGYAVPFESVRAVLGTIGIQTRIPGREVYRRLSPLADNVIRWTLMRIVMVTREHNAVPIFVGLNVVNDLVDDDMPALKDAEAAGFLVFNLLDLWQNRAKPALRIGEWDDHPNAAGNRVIADRLFELMYHHRAELHFPSDSPEIYLGARSER